GGEAGRIDGAFCDVVALLEAGDEGGEEAEVTVIARLDIPVEPRHRHEAGVLGGDDEHGELLYGVRIKAHIRPVVLDRVLVAVEGEEEARRLREIARDLEEKAP